MFGNASRGRRASSIVLSAALGSSLALFGASPAHASNNYTIELQGFNAATNGHNDQTTMDFFISNYGYPAGSGLKQMYADTGSTTTLSFLVKDGGTPAPSVLVSFAINKRYSLSTAKLTCNGTAIAPATDAADGGSVTATTNASGIATVTCVNSNSSRSGLTRPGSLVSASQITGSPHTQIWPTIASTAYPADMVEVFFVQPAGYSGVRAASPSLLTFEASDTLGALAAGDPNPSIDKWAGQFEGSGTGIAAAPGGTGSTLSQALQINKGNTNAWSGLNLVDYTDSDVKVTDGTHHVVTMNYFSPDTATSPVELQLLGTNTLSQCVDAAPGWNSLSFDFSTVSGWSDSNEYTKLVLFPNFKDNCANKGSFSTPASLTNQLYYIDNVNVNSYAAPANTVAPTVSGTLKVGKTVTANVGTWSGAAGTTTYKWYACKVKKTTAAASVTSAAKCSAISGGTSATLKLKSAQKGKYLRVLITQTNALGSATKLSKTFGKVK